MGRDNERHKINIMARLRKLGIEIEYADPLVPYYPYVLVAKRKDKQGYFQKIEKEYDHKPSAEDKYFFYKHVPEIWDYENN